MVGVFAIIACQVILTKKILKIFKKFQFFLGLIFDSHATKYVEGQVEIENGKWKMGRCKKGKFEI